MRMVTPKILILEDNQIIAQDIAATLKQHGYDIVGISKSGEEAIALARASQPDLALLDIRVKGDLDGIQTAEQLQQKHPIPIIYLTAHSDQETLKRAMETHPAHYLIKPFKSKELPIAIELALANFEQKDKTNNAINEETAHQATHYFINDSIFVKRTGHRFEKIALDQILWLEAAQGWFKIHCSNKSFTLSGNLSDFVRRISHPKLIRVHKSFIVNTDFIEAFERPNYLFVKGNKEYIPIGRKYRQAFFEHFPVM